LLYAIFALGVNVLAGYAGLVSLGHAGLFGIAAYTGAKILTNGYGHVVVDMAALALTVVAAAVFAVLALRGTGLGFVMITVALGQIVWGVAYRWISLTNGDNGISITGRPSPFGLSLASPRSFYWATLVVFLAAILAMVVFVASPFGASVRGTRDQPRRMNALGYHVWMIRFAAFLFSGFWSGVAGLLYLYYHQFVSPQAVALTASAEALLMVISGGTGTLLGPIVGAALVVVIKNVASAYIERWNFVLGAIFLITGELKPDRGAITLFDADITRVPGRRRAHLGIGRTYQIITLFPRDTLLRNVMLSLLALTRLRWNPFVRLDRQAALVDGARAV